VIKTIVFFVVSAGGLWLSRNSLRRPHSHGFYRFFAFEALLVLTLLNVDQWFADPFSAWQLLSWLSLIGSALLASHGFRLLRVIGQPEDGIEDTTVLVEVGAYRYIRHPLYASLMLFALGAFLKHISLPAGILMAISFAFLFATARVEERENLARFGEEYAEYMRRSRMFIPYGF
jgi:protein-S-isoprenylcysteine O-methyltransferase Ste14